MKLQHHVLRKIAHNTLAILRLKLSQEERNDLEISLVRQWVSNNGKAGLVFARGQLWFILEQKEKGFRVSRIAGTAPFAKILGERCGVEPEEMPEVLHRLNCTQSVVFDARGGCKLRASLDHDKHALHFEETLDDREEDT